MLVWIYRNVPGEEEPRVLMLKRAPPRAPEWHPVTGHVESGETLEEAAEREAVEETGCTPAAVMDLGYCYGFRGEHEGKPHSYEEHAFGMRVENEECSLSHEHEAFEWVPLEEAGPMLQFPEQRAALACLAERLSIPVAWDED